MKQDTAQKKRTVELLSPAGNMEGFLGAIHAGADAVYLGGRLFGARAYADNFSDEELLFCIRYAHLWNRRIYLTVNTLVKEKEFKQLYAYLQPLYQNGLDGVIVQDLGVLAFVREHFPGLALHASTQMTLTGAYGAAFLKRFGVTRIVPARELSLEEVKVLCKETGLEVECFIHGAMCYCYSGQCLFSSILGGRSGNRGRCAQPCRLPYRVLQEKQETAECYPLSLKDLCTIDHIPQLVEAGIASFKIEGRMKKPEYTAGVTAIYRKYLDLYTSGSPFAVRSEDREALAGLYLRSQRQDGYYFRTNGREMVTLQNPSYGKSEEALLASVRERFLTEKPKYPITMQARFCPGERAKLLLQCGDVQAKVEGDAVVPAQKQPISEENIRRQLGKLGESVFAMQELQLELSEQSFYPLKSLNTLRRQAVTALEEQLLAHYGFAIRREDFAALHEETLPALKALKREKPCYGAAVMSKEQLLALAAFVQETKAEGLRTFLIESRLLREPAAEVMASCAALAQKGTCFVALPYVTRKKDYQKLAALLEETEKFPEVFSGFLVRSLEQLAFLRSRQYRGKLLADAGIYLWNTHALRALSPYLGGFVLPAELRAAEMQSLLAGEPDLLRLRLVYGRVPLMVTANCVRQTAFGCQKAQKKIKQEIWCSLTDRYQKSFPVRTDCDSCYNVIYNAVPHALHHYIENYAGTCELLMSFTTETAKEVGEILRFFVEGMPDGALPFAEFTAGYEKRGVE